MALPVAMMLLGLVLLGVPMLTLARRGRRINRVPTCRQCDLTSVLPVGVTCHGCGSGLNRPHPVRLSHAEPAQRAAFGRGPILSRPAPDLGFHTPTSRSSRSTSARIRLIPGTLGCMAPQPATTAHCVTHTKAGCPWMAHGTFSRAVHRKKLPATFNSRGCAGRDDGSGPRSPRRRRRRTPRRSPLPCPCHPRANQ